MTRAFCRHTNQVFAIGIIALSNDEDWEGVLGITTGDSNPLTVVRGGSEKLDTRNSSSYLNASA